MFEKIKNILDVVHMDARNAEKNQLQQFEKKKRLDDFNSFPKLTLLIVCIVISPLNKNDE